MLDTGNKKQNWFLYLLGNFETYIGTACFIVIMILLFAQVVSRFTFGAITWTEELSIQLFVAMVYCGVSAAVPKRKHLRVDALLNAVPFKAKKAMLIISDIIFIGFNTYVSYLYISTIVPNLGKSVTSLLRIPKALVYSLIPILLTLTTIRLIFNIFKLAKETPQNLGTSTPVIDIEALEAEAAKLKEGGE